MSNKETTTDTDASSSDYSYKTWLIISPDLTTSGLTTESNFIHLPEAVTKKDLKDAWVDHRLRGGRKILDGGETFDHKTLQFTKVLTDLGAIAMAPEEIAARLSLDGVVVLKEPRQKTKEEVLKSKEKAGLPLAS